MKSLSFKKEDMLRSVKQYMIVLVLLVMCIVFGVIAPGFTKKANILNILLQSSIYGTMAMGMTCLIITGYFDLSAGVVMGFAANVCVMLLKHMSPVPAILLSLMICALIGLYNGFMVSRTKINAFIVTLSTMLSVRGILYIMTGGNSLSTSCKEFTKIGNTTVGGLSVIFIFYIGLLLVFWFFMRYSKHGRNTYAVGGNVEAAFNAGINLANTRMMNFMLCSITAGMGGIITAARMSGTSATIGWPDGATNIITCVVLGGTSLAGGTGGILYTFGGALAFAILRNGLNIKGVTGAWNDIVTGVLLIAILTIDKVKANNVGKKS